MWCLVRHFGHEWVTLVERYRGRAQRRCNRCGKMQFRVLDDDHGGGLWFNK